jgi:hypothetical protein
MYMMSRLNGTLRSPLSHGLIKSAAVNPQSYLTIF